jgi:REP element-mobilizing transposase RayT
MSRPLRYIEPDSLQHVTSRGNRKQDIVRDGRDRINFVEMLAQVVLDRRWILHAWVLMNNHVHLLVTAPLGNLSEGMRDLLGDYASRFNKVHDLVGHLFQHRFDTKPVERERHQLELTRYLPLNPVRCGLVRTPAEWPWSSYRATAGLEPVPPWLDVEGTLALFHPDRKVAQREFRQFVSLARDVEYDPWSELANGWILGSPSYCEKVQRWIDQKARSSEHPVRQRRLIAPGLDTLIQIVKKELTVSDLRLPAGAQRTARRLIADLGHEECGAKFPAIGAQLGVTAWAAAKLRSRSQAALADDPAYAALLRRVRESLREKRTVLEEMSSFQT